MKSKAPMMPMLMLWLMVLPINISGASEPEIASLIEQLGHHQPVIREAAMTKLIEIGPNVLPALTEVLGNGNETARESAIHVLSQMGEPAASALVVALNDSHERVRIAAIDALTSIEVSGQKIVPALVIALLTDESADIRQKAAHALGKIGPDATEAILALTKALRDDSEAVRINAAGALGEIGPLATDTISALADVLANDTSQLVRIRVVESLGKIGPFAPEETISTLQLFLNDENRQLRQTVVRMLGYIGQPTEEICPLLIEEFGDAGEAVRQEAVMALKQIGRPAIPYLIDAMGHEQKEVRFYAIMALGEMVPPAKEAVPMLIQALADADVCAIAARVLGQMGPQAEKAIPVLIDLLSDSQPIFRDAAAEALGRIGPDAENAVPSLIQLLEDENLGVRNQASRALGRIGEPAKAAVPYLMISILTDGDMRKNAVEALGNIGPSAQQATPTLIKAISDASPQVRQTAVTALWKVGADRTVAVPVLIRTLNTDNNEVVRAHTAEVLAKLRDPLEEIVPALIHALMDKHAAVHDRAVTALEEIGSPALPFLTQALNQKDNYEHVVYVLGRMAKADASTTEEIISALVSSSEHNQMPSSPEVVVDALRMIGPPAVAFLLRSFHDRDSDVREHAIYLLGEIGSPAGRIVPVLVKALNDEQETVALAAAKALRRIGTPQLILFRIDSAFQDELDRDDHISEDLRQVFEKNNISLPQNATLSRQKKGSRWLISDVNQTYTIWKEDEHLYVSATANIALLDHKNAERKRREAQRLGKGNKE